jgi:hypothetical protein
VCGKATRLLFFVQFFFIIFVGRSNAFSGFVAGAEIAEE